jgi:hypothetical protein
VSASDALFASRWVHVFEEDGPDGDVYRPEGDDLPLSRRPRRRISFARDGSARIVTSGPDDRLREIAARWREEGGEITVSADAAGGPATALRFRVRSAGCLLVRQEGAPPRDPLPRRDPTPGS